MADSDGLNGAQRAAVFLLSLGEEAAASIMQHMDPKEVQSVGRAMTELSSVSNDNLTQVIGNFVESLSTGSAVGSNPKEYVKNTLNKALGETKGRRMTNRILDGQDAKGMDALKWMDAQSVAMILKHEHPQIVAIVLSSLDSEHAAEVVKYFPEEDVPEIMIRVAQLDAIHPAALAELDELLQKQIVDIAPTPPSRVVGPQLAADIIGYFDSNVEAEVLDRLTEEDEDMGNHVRDLMFIFDNLLGVTDRDMQRLLQEVGQEKLAMAVKGA